MRKSFNKMYPRVINYLSYRDISNEIFRVILINNLSNEVFVNSDDRLEQFCKITMNTLNPFAPIMFVVIKFLSSPKVSLRK